MKVAVVGAAGFVGSAVVRALAGRPGVAVTPVIRETHATHRAGSYDVVVHAAMPSKRYWARQHPALDFAATVATTADLVHGWRCEKIVLVSTISARTQLDTVYGRHKAAAEALCAGAGHLVVRLGPMYGTGLAKGVLVDLLAGGPVYADGASRYAFAPVEWAGEWLAANLEHRHGVVEVGARHGLALRDVAAHLGVAPRFEGPLDHQEPLAPEPGFPDPTAVLAYLGAERAHRETAPARAVRAS